MEPSAKRCRRLPVGKRAIDTLGLLRVLVPDGFRGTLSLKAHFEQPDKNKALASRESLRGLLALIARV